MDKKLIKEVVREMIISGEIQIGIGKRDWQYREPEGTLILIVTDLEDNKKPLAKQNGQDGLSITELLHSL